MKSSSNHPNFLTRLKRAFFPPEVIVIKEPVPTEFPLRRGITLAQWRSSPDLAIAAQQIFKDPTFTDMMSVLRNSAPVGLPRGTVTNETQAIVEYGRIQGYMECLSILDNLPIPVEIVQELPEPDFGAEESIKEYDEWGKGFPTPEQLTPEQ